MQLCTTLPFLGIGTRPRYRPDSGPRHYNPDHQGRSHSPTRHGPASPPCLAPPALSVDSSSTTIAWSWSRPTSMRMSNPSCYRHKYIGVPLGPIESEWLKAPPPRFRTPRLEVSWQDSRLFGPSDSPCALLDHTDLLADILGSSIRDRDPLQAPIRPGTRMPGSVPRPERAPTSNTRGTERILGRPLNRLSPPEGHNSSTRDVNRGSLAGPQAHSPVAPRRPAPHSAKEDYNLVPDNTRSRRVAWAPATTQAGDPRQADKCEDACAPRCPCGRLRMPALTAPPAGGARERDSNSLPPWRPRRLWRSISRGDQY